MKTFNHLPQRAPGAPHRRFRRSLWLVAALLAGIAGAWAVQRLQTREATQSGAWVVVQTQLLAQAIVAEGPLAAASAVNIHAPFDGRILRRWVQPGDRVSAGAPLLQLDSTEVLAELREAQVAEIRARQALADVLDWSSSAEVAGARRQLTAARSQLAAAQGRLADTRTLFDKGIVARTDVESAQSELENATQQWHGAQDGLSSALHRGSAEPVHIARLEAELRSTRVRLLQGRLAQATLSAPQSGVVLAPSAEIASQGPAPKEFEVGTMVSAKDVLMTVGDTSMLMVRAQLDEFDAVRVNPGLAVQVSLGTDGAVILGGELHRVSAQARRDAGSGGGGASGSPMFDIQVLIRELPSSLRQRLRLGLTARLSMVAEPQAEVLSIPLAAVRMDAAGHAFARRRTAIAPSGPGEEVPLQTGPTLHNRVVVHQGLTAGDFVWLPQSSLGEGQSQSSGVSDASPDASWPFGLGGPP